MADALMVTPSFLPGRGGIESYLAALCSELAPRVAVLAPAQRDGKSIPEDLGYETVGFPGSMLVPARRIADSIVQTAERLGTDRVLFGTPWPLVLLAPRLRRAGLRYAVIVHGAELLVPAAIPILRRRLATALSGADLLLPVSEFTAGKIRALLEDPQPPIELLRARVDLTRFNADAPGAEARRRLGIGVDRRVILVFGRLVRRKGVHRLLDVLPDVHRRVPGAVLVVAGTGPERRRLERRAGASVVFAGRVDDADAPGVYAAAEVFCLPVSDRWFGLDVEGLGVVLLEAAACALPCVTGRSGGTPEAVKNGETGYVIDARDHRALVDAICAVLEHPDAAKTMGLRGRDHVLAEFSNRTLPSGLMQWLG
jgi:phosphatidylinositol alpha-1,6-mannosyltransferase